MAHSIEEKKAAFERLLGVLDTLRVKCPWDAKQTNESLRPNTIEEVYELCDALLKGDSAEIRKECGDVLLHVCFYAKIAEEKGDFDMADVCNALCDKLIFRHPHVYGDAVAENAKQVSENWEQIKLREKGGNKSVLAGVPGALPTLIKAYRIQDKARNAGFDWGLPDQQGGDPRSQTVTRAQVWEKVKEEINELQAEIDRMETAKAGGSESEAIAAADSMEAEFGDLLFSLVNAARLYKINPDNALERTNQKFIRRFNYIEAKAAEQQKPLRDMTLGEMDALWNEAKKQGL